MGYPSTNNGLEVTNAVIKRNHTFRERLPVGQFLVKVLQIVAGRSEARNPSSTNCKNFLDQKLIKFSEWTSGFQWAMENKKVLECKHGSYTLYFTSARKNPPITTEMLTQYLAKQQQWETFEEF